MFEELKQLVEEREKRRRFLEYLLERLREVVEVRVSDDSSYLH